MPNMRKRIIPKIPEETVERSRMILQFQKDKDSPVSFIRNYIGLAVFLALPAIVHMRVSNLGTLSGGLELLVFFVSLPLVTIAAYKKVNRLKIREQNTTVSAYGGVRFSERFDKLFILFAFAVLVAFSFVWGAMNVNRLFDTSHAKEIIGQVKTKKTGYVVFLSSYMLNISANVPNFNEIKVKVNEKAYNETTESGKVVLFIKEGALGAPYIAAVKPYPLVK